MSLTCEVERPDPEAQEVRGVDDVVGVDVGLESFAVLSDGTRPEAPRPLRKALRRLRRLARQLARKQEETVEEVDPETEKIRRWMVFSQNYRKAALRLSRLHRRVRNIHLDFLHQVTTGLAKAKPVLVVEDQNVREMVQSEWLSRSVADAGGGAFRRMLAYKCAGHGARLVVASRSFPSTQRGSRYRVIAPTSPLLSGFSLWGVRAGMVSVHRPQKNPPRANGALRRRRRIAPFLRSGSR